MSALDKHSDIQAAVDDLHRRLSEQYADMSREEIIAHALELAAVLALFDHRMGMVRTCLQNTVMVLSGTQSRRVVDHSFLIGIAELLDGFRSGAARKRLAAYIVDNDARNRSFDIAFNGVRSADIVALSPRISEVCPEIFEPATLVSE